MRQRDQYLSIIGVLYTLLVAAFGVGIWKSAEHTSHRQLRIVGMLFVVSGVIGLGWPPMHQRPVLAAGGGTFTDTMHLVWSVVTVLLVARNWLREAAAFGRRFRLYTIETMNAVLWCADVSRCAGCCRQSPDAVARRMGTHQRLGDGWQAVFAMALLRSERRACRPELPWTTAAFKSARGSGCLSCRIRRRNEVVASVSYREVDVPGRFGPTHVVVSGPVDGAPLVLLHGYGRR